ncbi:MAG: hypothetical protein JW892_11205 [Anaerolineae bacterium]|nr:hypothetical protein [Anaerolineae bacterium]
MVEQYKSGISWTLWTAPKPVTLEEAILYTLAYADVFSYPLRLDELQRYLVGFRASVAEVDAAARATPGIVEKDGYYLLHARGSIVALRMMREQVAAAMWPRALAYGKAIARLPFVRMVALTGALPVRNVNAGDDFDYLIVTAPGHVWLSRLLIIQLVVKPSARRGDEVCPNYILAENALTLAQHDLFHAHELAQMIPLYGLPVYERLRQANTWTEAFLPNAENLPVKTSHTPQPGRLWRTVLEPALSVAAGTWLERREIARLQRKLLPQGEHAEVQLSLECCKGHVGAHEHSTFEAFAARLIARGLDTNWNPQLPNR